MNFRGCFLIVFLLKHCGVQLKWKRSICKTARQWLKPGECSFNCVNGLNDFRQITLLPWFLAWASGWCRSKRYQGGRKLPRDIVLYKHKSGSTNTQGFFVPAASSPRHRPSQPARQGYRADDDGVRSKRGNPCQHQSWGWGSWFTSFLGIEPQ